MTLSYISYNRLIHDTLGWCDANSSRESSADSWRFLLGVVGIPKSGMIPAQVIASRFNCPVVDLESFLSTGGRFYPNKGARSGQYWYDRDRQLRLYGRGHLLVVDDSLHEGSTMRAVREEVYHHLGLSVSVLEFAAVYGSGHSKEFSYYKEVPLPRLFEWNWQKHPSLETALVDMDGVICKDWTGPGDSRPETVKQYEEWLETVEPLYLPTRKVAAVVSARIEKYRHQTRAWLEKWGVKYDNLYLCPRTWEEIRKDNSHWLEKAEVYKQSASQLFIESDPDQADKINEAAGKPVFCPPRYGLSQPWYGEVFDG